MKGGGRWRSGGMKVVVEVFICLAPCPLCYDSSSLVLDIIFAISYPSTSTMFTRYVCSTMKFLLHSHLIWVL